MYIFTQNTDHTLMYYLKKYTVVVFYIIYIIVHLTFLLLFKLLFH